MLDIPKLKALATKQLQTELDANWEAGKFSVVVAEVFDITASRDKGIRDVVILAAKKHLAELLPLEHFGEVMDKYGEFSAGLVRVMSTAIHTECKCTSCGQKYRHYCDYCI
jgi:hypothetical protein